MEKETIKRIRELNKKGLSKAEIARKLELSVMVVSYWLLSKEERKKLIKKKQNYFKKKSKEERSKVYKKRLPYLRKYQRKRYKTDKEYREMKKRRFREYYKKLKGGKNNE